MKHYTLKFAHMEILSYNSIVQTVYFIQHKGKKYFFTQQVDSGDNRILDQKLENFKREKIESDDILELAAEAVAQLSE